MQAPVALRIRARHHRIDAGNQRYMRAHRARAHIAEIIIPVAVPRARISIVIIEANLNACVAIVSICRACRRGPLAPVLAAIIINR